MKTSYDCFYENFIFYENFLWKLHMFLWKLHVNVTSGPLNLGNHNYRRIKNLIVSLEAISTLKFWSRSNILTVVLQHSNLWQYIRIVATNERKCKTRQKVSWSSAKICMILLTEFFGHKNLLITQHKNGHSCILFSKARVCLSLLKTPTQRTRLFSSFVRSCHHHH